MNIEEAIKFAEGTEYVIFKDNARINRTKCALEYNRKMDIVIELLQCGKKYKEMWEELEKVYGRLGLTDEIRDLPNFDLRIIMKTTKQEYFPKGGSQC